MGADGGCQNTEAVKETLRPFSAKGPPIESPRVDMVKILEAKKASRQAEELIDGLLYKV